jgi:hypothetical protein
MSSGDSVLDVDVGRLKALGLVSAGLSAVLEGLSILASCRWGDTGIDE